MRRLEQFDIRNSDLTRRRRLAPCVVVGLIACWLFLAGPRSAVAQATAESPETKTPAKPAESEKTPASAQTAATKPASAQAPGNVQPWEYSPYRIRVWLAATAAAEFHPDVLAELRHDLVRRADAAVGPPWSLTVESPPPELASTIAYAPELVTTVEIAKFQKEALQGDKVIWVSLQANAREMQVRARELDCHTRTWGQTVVQPVRQPAALNQSAFDAILAVFCPLARIEDGKGKTCVVRVRAFGLMLGEDSPAWIGKGDALQPVFRLNDRFGEPVNNRTQVLPFTFLHVTNQNALSASLLDCNVHAMTRSPIQGRAMSRRERWALKVRPFLSTTDLVVENRPSNAKEKKVRLAGLEIYAKTPVAEPPAVEAPKPETEEEKVAAEKKDPPELIGITDWRGQVTIPNQGTGLRLLYIKSGGLLLARVPMIAGLESRLVAEVPNDDPRLQAEGFVKGMNGEITDLVVQRHLIRARVRKKIAEGKFDDAEKLLDQFRDLKTMQDLQRTLDQQMTRQKRATNPLVQQRIDQLYAEERELIAKHVDADILTQLTSELVAAKAKPPSGEAKEEANGETAKTNVQPPNSNDQAPITNDQAPMTNAQ